MEAFGPKSTPGLVEVPSLGTTIRAATLLAVQLGVDLDLEEPFFFSSSGGIGPLFLESATCFPFFEGEISGVSSRGRFSPMTMPFVARVAPLDLPPHFAI